PTTANAFQPDKPAEGCEYPPCGVAFVTKVDAAGNALVYSTFLGGTYGPPTNEFAGTNGTSIAVNSAGNAYVTGSTFSIDFPTANAIQASYGGGDDDAFVTALTADGSHLIYSTFIGGSRADAGNGIAVDSSGNAYVVGGTESLAVPSANPFQSTLSGYSDSFVVKIGSANAPAVSFSPVILSFSNQGINTMSAPRAITVSNRGTSPVAINQITFTGANSGDFAETDNCGTPVAGGASCTVSVTFTPSTGGTERAAVSVADNAAGTPQTVP